MRRRLAYSCWSTASGARVNNYGSRIDLILAADAESAPAGPSGASHSSRAAAGLQAGAASGAAEGRGAGTAHVPAFARGTHPGAVPVLPNTGAGAGHAAQGSGAAHSRCEGGAGGQACDPGLGFHGWFTGADVWADAQGSDHAPVWADVALPEPLPRPPAPPPLSTRFMFTGAHTDASASHRYLILWAWHRRYLRFAVVYMHPTCVLAETHNF